MEHVKPGQVKSGQVKSGQVKPEKVKSSWGRSSQVRTGQVKLGPFKSSWEVQLSPDRIYFLTQHFWPKVFLPYIFFDSKLIWSQKFLWNESCVGFNFFWTQNLREGFKN